MNGSTIDVPTPDGVADRYLTTRRLFALLDRAVPG